MLDFFYIIFRQLIFILKQKKDVFFLKKNRGQKSKYKSLEQTSKSPS